MYGDIIFLFGVFICNFFIFVYIKKELEIGDWYCVCCIVLLVEEDFRKINFVYILCI